MGGDSNERAVSLLSGDAVFKALKRLGIEAEAFDPSDRDIEEIKTFNRVFIALHGRGGEDGSMQAFLKSKNVAYTCLLYTSPSPRDRTRSRMPSSA